jgi:hypothetical protein
MPLCRAAFAALLALYSSAAVFAQEPSRLPAPDPLSNWTAPPYWMPAATPAPEKRAIALNDIAGGSTEARISPEAIQAVPTSPLAFTGINPCRVADTRGNGFTGQYGPPQITPAGRTITIANVCGIPAAAQAVSFNFSAVNVPGAGFLVAYPAGGAFPASATMTYNENTPTLSNAAVVPLGTAGAITVVAGVVSIDLVIDVNGYYAPQTVVNTVNGLSGAVTLAPGSNVSITPAGNTLTIANTAPAAWRLDGNAGTSAGTDFLGTTDNQALELRVNDERVLRLEPSPGAPNLIGGLSLNSVTAGVVGATIAGGGLIGGNANVVTDDYGVIGGGAANRAGDGDGTLSDKEFATIGGGISNLASGSLTFIGGGQGNHATEVYSTIAGGASNTASGYASTVPGGFSNTALLDFSLAAGKRAKANHAGAFVWGDNTNADVASTGANQFIVRASGGIWLGTTSTPSITIASDYLNTSTGAHLTIGGVWTNNSDREAKENFQEIDAQDVLSRVATLPITRWNYKAEGCEVEHIGPMAQDFAAAFGLGSDDRSIGTLDSSGVALAAIQALYEIVQEKDSRIEALEKRLTALERRK